MKKRQLRERPILLFRRTDDDREACRCLRNAGISYEMVSAAPDDVTPVLLFGLEESVGLAEIKRFVENWLRAEDLSDVLDIAQRKDEPSRDYSDFAHEL